MLKQQVVSNLFNTVENKTSNPDYFEHDCVLESHNLLRLQVLADTFHQTQQSIYRLAMYCMIEMSSITAQNTW